MTGEFDHVRASFASSRPARALAFARQVTVSGWRSSAARRAWQRAGGGLGQIPAPALIRTAAVAIAVAAALQPLLMVMMPPTVRPAVPPYVFVVVALLAVAAAWQPGEAARALPASQFARWLRR